jgi:hypothetical protein
MRRIHAYADGINLTAVTEAAVAGRNEIAAAGSGQLTTTLVPTWGVRQVRQLPPAAHRGRVLREIWEADWTGAARYRNTIP